MILGHRPRNEGAAPGSWERQGRALPGALDLSVIMRHAYSHLAITCLSLIGSELGGSSRVLHECPQACVEDSGHLGAGSPLGVPGRGGAVRGTWSP